MKGLCPRRLACAASPGSQLHAPTALANPRATMVGRRGARGTRGLSTILTTAHSEGPNCKTPLTAERRTSRFVGIITAMGFAAQPPLIGLMTPTRKGRLGRGALQAAHEDRAPVRRTLR